MNQGSNKIVFKTFSYLASQIKPMKTPALLLLLILCSGKLLAQSVEKFEPALMEAKFGAKLIYTSETHSVTLDIVSKNIKTTDNPSLINVDEKPLQLVWLTNTALSTIDTTQTRRKAELLGYVDYEVKYAKDELKLKISDVQTAFVNINSKFFIFWSYNMPPDNKSVLKQINLTTLCFAHILNLNNPVTVGQTVETNKKLLFDVANTIKLNNYKINLSDMYKKLQDEMKQ
jgi:hypothetical protein